MAFRDFDRSLAVLKERGVTWDYDTVDRVLEDSKKISRY